MAEQYEVTPEGIEISPDGLDISESQFADFIAKRAQLIEHVYTLICGVSDEEIECALEGGLAARLPKFRQKADKCNDYIARVIYYDAARRVQAERRNGSRPSPLAKAADHADDNTATGSMRSDAPEVDDVPVPVIDRSKLDARNAKTADPAGYIADDDIAKMSGRLRKVFTAEDFATMNREIKRYKQRALSWYEFAFIACVHRRSILSNHYAIEKGKHCGDSPTKRPGTLAEESGLDLDRITAHQSAEVFRTLELVGFAARVGEDKGSKQCARYSAEPSDFWGFPPINTTDQ